MSAAVQIARDPFGRLTLFRRIFPARPDGFANCGGTNARGKLFQYGVQHDGISSRIEWRGGLYCSKACQDSYWT